MPGAGAEILVDAVRDVIAPKKIDASRWLEIHEAAHEIGMLTTATMMYGVGEVWEDRLEHLFKLRESQKRSLARGAGHYTAFIAWSFQPLRTEMEGGGIELGTGMDYLRMTALSRLILDDFDNVQVSYVTQGPKMAQLALTFGANDFGSVMIEENVVSAAGTDFIMPESEIRRLIEDAGFTPRRRYHDYSLFEDGDEGCPCCARRGAAALPCRRSRGGRPATGRRAREDRDRLRLPPVPGGAPAGPGRRRDPVRPRARRPLRRGRGRPRSDRRDPGRRRARRHRHAFSAERSPVEGRRFDRPPAACGSPRRRAGLPCRERGRDRDL